MRLLNGVPIVGSFNTHLFWCRPSIQCQYRTTTTTKGIISPIDMTHPSVWSFFFSFSHTMNATIAHVMACCMAHSAFICIGLLWRWRHHLPSLSTSTFDPIHHHLSANMRVQCIASNAHHPIKYFCYFLFSLLFIDKSLLSHMLKNHLTRSQWYVKLNWYWILPDCKMQISILWCGQAGR